MPSIVIEGVQWGDEGKGKVVDYLASKSNVVIRFQGGNNAGHTVCFDNKTFAIKSLPSGIFTPNIINIIADGVVVNPFFLKDNYSLQEHSSYYKFCIIRLFFIHD